jgi:hypothetical protein
MNGIPDSRSPITLLTMNDGKAGDFPIQAQVDGESKDQLVNRGSETIQSS